MEAIVLAGGFGTRLRHIVSDVPKPMAPVDGRPFLRYILDSLAAQGMNRVILAVGYKMEVIKTFFGSSYRGMELIYSPEDTPLFTGGAIKKALTLCRENEVFVLNGDTMFDVDLAAMHEFKQKKQAAFVLAAKAMHDFDRYGTLELTEDGRIRAFREKRPCREGVINGGIYLMDRAYLEDFPKKTFSFECEVMEARVNSESLYAYISDGYFIDIGVPEDYARAQKELSTRHPVQKAAIFDRDGTINVDVHYLHDPKDCHFVEGMPEFLAKWRQWGYKVLVVTNQAGIARGYYSAEDMQRLHCWMNEQLAFYGAHIDAFYYCPHHPDVTGPCHCRKPEPGMLEQAIREFDLDPAQCIVFGDQPWDVEAGRAVGIFSVQVTRHSID